MLDVILLGAVSNEDLETLLVVLGSVSVVYLVVYKLMRWWQDRPKDTMTSSGAKEAIQENTAMHSSDTADEENEFRLAA